VSTAQLDGMSHCLQPRRRVRGLSELKPSNPPVVWVALKLPELPCPAVMRGEYPKKDRIARKEGTEKRLPVPVPQHFATPSPSNGSYQTPPEHHGQRVVQPDNDIDAWPEYRAHDAVVAIGYPAWPRGRVAHQIQEFLGWLRLPPSRPEQLVQLDCWNGQRSRKRTCQGRLPGGTGADHQDARAYREVRHDIERESDQRQKEGAGAAGGCPLASVSTDVFRLGGRCTRAATSNPDGTKHTPNMNATGSE